MKESSCPLRFGPAHTQPLGFTSDVSSFSSKLDGLAKARSHFDLEPEGSALRAIGLDVRAEPFNIGSSIRVQDRPFDTPFILRLLKDMNLPLFPFVLSYPVRAELVEA